MWRLLSFRLFSMSSRRTLCGRTPSQNPDLRLSRIRPCETNRSHLSIIYTDIYSGSYQWIAVIYHIQKFYPVVAFLDSSDLDSRINFHYVVSKCCYSFCIVCDSIVMVITSQYLIEFVVISFSFHVFMCPSVDLFLYISSQTSSYWFSSSL